MKRPLIYILSALMLGPLVGKAMGGDLSRIGVNTERPQAHAPACPTIDAMKTGEPKSGGYVWQGGMTDVAGPYTLITASGSSIVNATNAPFLKPPGALKLLRAGYTSDAGTFTTDYLASKEPFGVIRLMNWQAANDATVARWADRAKPSDPYWSDLSKGAPIEPWLDYARGTGKSLWINVPFTADDDYVDNLARLCGEFLRDTNVHLFIEHSNEVWNTNTRAGQAVWAASRGSGVPRLNIHAKRTIEIGKAFKRHLPSERVHTQLGLQLGNYGEGEAAALWAVQQYGRGHFDISVAPYLGNPSTPSESTPAGYATYLLDQATRWRDQPNSSSSVVAIRKWKALADRVGGKLTAYEFGVDLKTDRDVPDRAAAQSLPDTGKAVTIYIDVLMREGFSTAVYYKDFSQYNSSGYWGLTNSPKNLRTAKYIAAATAAAKYSTGVTPVPVPPTSQPTPPPVTQPAPLTLEIRFADLERRVTALESR